MHMLKLTAKGALPVRSVPLAGGFVRNEGCGGWFAALGVGVGAGAGETAIGTEQRAVSPPAVTVMDAT
jgi:hypothetical protein